MKYASVCSGVEAASLAWMPLGWEAAWFSEIEPFPCAVLKERFPNVPNLGDMTKIEVENLENGDQKFIGGDGTTCTVRGGVDLLVGGTPCQSFSVAGKREGLEGASGLAKSFVELLGAMRPRWFVWENVPGCLSSLNKRTGVYDFNFLLAAFAERGYSCAWRILDAQYVRVDGYPRAVPQRRRRVFVVGHSSADWRYPASVLFEPDSLFGDTPPRRVKGKGFTGNLADGVGAASAIRMRAGKPGGKGALVSNDLSLTLAAGGNDQVLVNIAEDNAGRPWDDSGVNPTLNQCNAGSGIIGASNQELFSQNANGLVMTEVGKGYYVQSEQGQTLEAHEDQHRRNIVCTAHETGQGFWQSGETAGTLRAEGENRPSRPSNIVCTAGSFMGGQVAEASAMAKEVSQTLHCMHDHAAVLAVAQNQLGEVRTGDVAGTLNTNCNASGRNTPMVCITKTPTICAQEPISQYGKIAGTLEARHDSSPCADQGQNVVAAAFCGNMGAKAGNIGYEEECSPVLKAGGGGGGPPGERSYFRKGAFGQFVKDDIGSTLQHHEGRSPDQFVVEKEIK